MPTTPHLTVSEKIMLHLLGYLKHEDKFEVPYSLTQDGIAEAVGVRRSYVSQAARELIQKELVSEKLSHVKGEARRRRTYFLTLEGKVQAEKLKVKVNDMNVILRGKEGEREVKLKDINRLLNKNLTILELLGAVSDEGVFDLQIRPPRPSAHIDFTQTYPRPKYFFGRKNELKEIKEWLRSKDMKILVIKGMAGIGKTTLMAEVASKESKRRILWYKFHNWSTLRNLLSHLSEFLIEVKKDALKLYLEENRMIDIGDVQVLLSTQLIDLNALLIFDDFHKADDPILGLFEALCEILKDKKGIKIVLLGRKIPRFYDRREVVISRIVSELQLEGLDKNSSLEILKKRKIDSEHLDKIYENTKGHPLSLELVEVTKGKITKRNIKQFLSEEVLKRLNEKEKELLGFASVFRFPVNSEALLSIPVKDEKEGISHETIDHLVEMSLLSSQDPLYDVHDVIREFFYNRLGPAQKTVYHKKVAEYFEDQADDLALIEAQYHYIKAKNQNKAVELAIQYGEHLIFRGYLEEFYDILSSIEKKNLLSSEVIPLLTMEADVLTTLGQWDSALSLLEKSLSAAMESGDPRGIARAYYKIAAIHYRKGSLNEALLINEKSLEILKEVKEPQELSKLYNNIGVIYWKKRIFDSAKDNYKKSMKISEELGDKRGVARALNNLGIISWEEGKLNEAKDFYEQSLEIAKEKKDLQTVAILYDNLGEVYRMKEDVNKAMEFYKKSLKLSEKLGFRWQIAEVYRNMGNVIQGEEGKRYLRKAYEMFMNLGAEKDAEELETRL